MKDRRKRKHGDWHHRVPDFQLVYCGPKKNSHIKAENSDKNSKRKEKIEKALR